MIAEHPLLSYIEDAFADNDTESYRNFKRTLSKKFPHVQLGIQFKSIEQMKSVTNWEVLNEEEQAVYRQQAEAKFPEAQRSFDFILNAELPPIVGSKNAAKFTPHTAYIRTGNLTTFSEVGSLFGYVGELAEENQFRLVLDDRTYEDTSVIQYDPRLQMARGLQASYLYMKGNLNKQIQKVCNSLKSSSENGMVRGLA